MRTRLNAMISKHVRPEERPLLLWAWLYFFSILSAYYVIRPIRDDMGVEGGLENLPWLYTSTLVGMLVFNIPFAALTKKLSRVRLIAATYRFFIVNLLLFFVAFLGSAGSQYVWVGRAFFVWTSIFNLSVVAVFWILMVDVFDSEQAKRLFGLIAAGGTLGAIAGSLVTMSLVHYIPGVYLILGAALLLEVAVQSARRLSRLGRDLPHRDTSATRGEPIQGSVLSGLTHTFKSPYLIGVTLYILLFAVTSSSLYLQQARIAQTSFPDASTRTAFFAEIDLWVNALTFTLQLFLTGQTLRLLGVGVTLAILPVLSVLGFTALALWPTVTVFVVFQVLRRAGHFAFSKPTREVLFTVVPREDKYRAKGFMDTVIYRTGDQIGAWSQKLMTVVGWDLTGIALIAVPISILWFVNGIWLGVKQRRLAGECSSNENEVLPPVSASR